MSRTLRKRTHPGHCDKNGRVKKNNGYIGVVVDGEQIASAASCVFSGDVDVRNGCKDIDHQRKKYYKRLSAKFRRRIGLSVVRKAIKENYDEQ